MTIAAASLAPWVGIDNRKILFPTFRECVVELGLVGAWCFPHVFWVPKEHTKKMTAATTSHSVGGASMHDTQVIDELHVSILSIELCRKTLSNRLDDLHSMKLLHGDIRHCLGSRNARGPEKRGLYELANRLATGEEHDWLKLEVRI